MVIRVLNEAREGKKYDYHIYVFKSLTYMIQWQGRQSSQNLKV